MRLRMPAEWEPHAATWIAWPHSREWFAGRLPEVEDSYVAIAAALARSERVNVLVPDETRRARAAERLRGIPAELHVVETHEIWLRDTGPTFAVRDDGERVAIDWTFNAWGGKYPDSALDDAVAGRVAALAGVRALRPGLVMEGGALEVDGDGTLLLVESTALGPTRNPDLSREDLERRLAGLLGVTRVIWLRAELPGDDTDGHVDNVARFVAPGRVACARALDPQDAARASLEECRALLAAARDARGRPLELVDLPLPPPIAPDGRRLPASYANFYVANRAVLVPVFGAGTDRTALDLLAKCFTGREIVPIPALPLVRDFGGVHCLTQQEPV
jgi:agmatine deiminase